MRLASWPTKPARSRWRRSRPPGPASRAPPATPTRSVCARARFPGWTISWPCGGSSTASTRTSRLRRCWRCCPRGSAWEEPMADTLRGACATCGTCCRSHLIPVCGYDVWRISMRQHLSPEQFLVAWGQAEPGRDGFRLDAGGKLYGLALDKQGPFEAHQRCVFLLRLADGQDRCGIYADRPAVCRVFPMASWRGVVYKRADAACPPGSWPPDTQRRALWRESFQQLHMHFDIYHEVVARWNARVESYPGQHFALSEYFSYLLNVYAALDRLATATGPEMLAAVQASWPRVPRF